ncbi:hypothetical protein BS47DRAFT_1390672 [Hydnum rufescens UP504]|uniref:Uncharacterized protein n=1 Tax=Hydnum rufescens UP504 TaxID=1448309 RepID=A0A9P6DZ69_9AGAM|nr:hypothetical protein BS47DRAFT_1390672 [Hydnum rufescens UP504]
MSQYTGAHPSTNPLTFRASPSLALALSRALHSLLIPSSEVGILRLLPSPYTSAWHKAYTAKTSQRYGYSIPDQRSLRGAIAMPTLWRWEFMTTYDMQFRSLVGRLQNPLFTAGLRLKAMMDSPEHAVGTGKDSRKAWRLLGLLRTIQGTILEECLQDISPRKSHRGKHATEVIPPRFTSDKHWDPYACSETDWSINEVGLAYGQQPPAPTSADLPCFHVVPLMPVVLSPLSSRLH